MYTNEQIQELLENANVSNCSETNITYTKEFRVKAIKRYYAEGYSPAMIFFEAGFDLDIIGHEKPKECIKRWRAIYNSQGEKGLSTETRGNKGGRPSKPKNDAERIKFLEAKVAYLDAENDFLAKLRGIKRRKFSNHPKSSRS